MKTADVLTRFKNAPKVAKILNVTKQAVYQWGDLVPEAAAFKLLEIEPSLPHKRVS
ncbi:Cro/CI family transcriptional regulator [Acinetobacter vivianii]|uniref:Cro/CI family transcriptional regulator n=2 Tax=Acinetobacter vivianii TaxID=1776742 RepID=A0AAJ6NH30_9GAMM|nr:Cro/CI family transcriptional regulator [Acinetobacter vivianii]WDZ50208.1 Cro/CI family transcriptional regulator [Acinetobacter vivianii]